MIGKVIKYKFDNTSNLNSVFAGRVYPLVGAEGSKDADSYIDIVNIELTLVGDSFSILQTAVENIRTSFVRMKETIEGVIVQSCGFDSQSEIFNVDEETFAVSVDLVFRIVRN